MYHTSHGESTIYAVYAEFYATRNVNFKILREPTIVTQISFNKKGISTLLKAVRRAYMIQIHGTQTPFMWQYVVFYMLFDI